MNKSIPSLPPGKQLILFDGLCNFCNYWVNFIIKRDGKDIFRFAALQSDAGQKILKDFDLSTEDFDTFVLFSDGKILLKSTAALKVLKEISGPLKLLFPLIIVPKIFRDIVYSFIARHRYRVFGKSDSCRVPTADEIKKFI